MSEFVAVGGGGGGCRPTTPLECVNEKERGQEESAGLHH